MILTITYGKTTPTAYTDPEVVSINHCFDRVMRAVRPGTYLSSPEVYTILSEHAESVAQRRAYALPGSGRRCQAISGALIHLTLARNQ